VCELSVKKIKFHPDKYIDITVPFQKIFTLRLDFTLFLMGRVLYKLLTAFQHTKVKYGNKIEKSDVRYAKKSVPITIMIVR
jgi:hypothetical protein